MYGASSQQCAESSLGEEPGLRGFEAIPEKDVYKVIKDINVSKSSGLDNISSFIVKEAFTALLTEVTFMYNLSIETSIFPCDWKRALVVPIPKAGNLTKVQNYRPISLLPLPGKILEKLVHGQLSTYLESEFLLSDKQHGFRKNHSTTHATAQFTNYVSKHMDSGVPTLAAYIDFKKAFDCVQHPVLLAKLAQFGLNRPGIEWVRSYLVGRKQKVFANNMYSSYQNVLQGVPQGSVLGPLFYIMYANDISKTVKNCEVALYADDTVLFTANRDFDVSINSLQEDINALAGWCCNNGIRANTEKTKVMVFGSPNKLKKLQEFQITFGTALLQTVTSYKYLGVTLDGQLNYNLHVNKIIGSVTSKLRQFKRMRTFLNTKAAILVYKSMLLPILEYGDVFLSASTDVNKRRLQILQNKGLRCALNKGIETSTNELHAEAHLLRLKFRREQHTLNYMYDLSLDASLMKVKPKEGIKIRSHNKRLMKIKRPKTERFKKSLAYAGPKKWNDLPEQFHLTRHKDAYKTLVSKLVSQKAADFESGNG